MPLLSIPCADRRQERKSEQSDNKINLCNSILETPRLSLIPVTKIASIHEGLSDPLNDTVKSKELSGWKEEFESLGYGLWCIHSDVNDSSNTDLFESSSGLIGSRLSLHFTDDFNFRLPPSSVSSSNSPQVSLPIGYIHLSKDSFINLGIFERYTSQGYATEALKKLLSVIFDVGLTNGIANVKVENAAIARVVEKLGFKEREKSIFSISKTEFQDLWKSIDDFE